MAKQDYIIGLDLGIASVGWACVAADIFTDQNGKEQAQPMGLIDCGVRCFKEAEVKDKTKPASLNFARRAARSQRRTIARRANRMRQVRKLLFKHRLLTANEFAAVYTQNPKNKPVDTTFFKKRNQKLLNKINSVIASEQGERGNPLTTNNETNACCNQEIATPCICTARNDSVAVGWASQPTATPTGVDNAVSVGKDAHPTTHNRHIEPIGEISQDSSPASQVQNDGNHFSGSLKDNEKAFFSNVWQLRVEALHRLLTRAEFAAVICHLVKHRGYLSTRKSERKKDDETGKMLKGVADNAKLLENKEYQSPAEIAVYKFLKENGQMRNKKILAFEKDKNGKYKTDANGNKIPIYEKIDKVDENGKKIKDENGKTIQETRQAKENCYLHTFRREDLANELRLIFEKQKEFGNADAKPDLCSQLCHILVHQRDAGSFEKTRKNVGHCSFEPDEERAPKHCYTAERFNFLQKINNLCIKQDGQERALSDDERRLLKDILFRKLLPEEAKQMGMRKEYLDDGITYAQLRKLLLPENAENARFNIGYHLKNDMEKLLNGALKPVKIKNKFANISKKEKDNILYDIEHILISHQGQPEQIVQKMQKYQQHFSENEISAISKIVLLSEKQKLAEIEKKEKLFEAKFFYDVKEAYEKHNLLEQWESLKDNHKALDKLGFVVSLSQKDKEIEGKINSDEKDLPHSDYVFSQDEIKAICEELDFKEFHHLSLKCMKKLLPEMENGVRYDKACEKVYGNHYGRSKDKYDQETLPPIDKSKENVPNSPVVYRSITQARKIINALIAQYGKPFSVHIELTRELGKSRESRDEIKERQDKNREERQIARNQAIAELAEHKLSTNPTEKDILKFRLFKHQDDHCAYCDCKLDIHRLLEQSYVEIEHILPKSRSQDDSFDNKVLACRKCNQDKTDLTPYEWFGQDEEKWQNFVGRVNANPHFSYRKKQNLLRKELPKEFVGRDLSETRYITRFLKNYIEKYPNIFSGSPTYMSEDGEEHNRNMVFCPQGSLTSALRASWGFAKVREDNDRHHALDAIVVACATPAMQQKLTAYYQWYERRYKKDEWNKEEWEKFTTLLQRKQEKVDTETGEVKYLFPVPWGFPEWFNTEINLRVFNQLPKRDENGDIVRIENKIQYEPLNNPYQKEELLAALAKHLPNCPQAIHDNVTPLFVSRMVSKDRFGRVHKDGLDKEKEVLNKDSKFQVRGGYSEYDSPVRIDIFKDDKGNNYFVPIYVNLAAQKLTAAELPKPQKKDRKGNIIPTEFYFSLYPYDLVEIEDDGVKEFAYYLWIKANGQACFKTPDATFHRKGTGKTDEKGEFLKSILGLKLKKYKVDILGKHLIEIEKEERQGFDKLFNDDDDD